LYKTLQIIASCTERKRVPVPPDLHLGSIRDGKPIVEVSTWWRQLNRHSCPTREAQDMYAGDHWSIVRELPRLAEQKGFRTNLWVASAGYGLIPSDALIRPYSATFSHGNADSISPSRNGVDWRILNAKWWKALSTRKGPVSDVPRSVGGLLRDHPNTHLLVVASPPYISAMMDDITNGIRETRKPNRVVIVTSGDLVEHYGIRKHVVPADARLQELLGGTRISLYARTARKILSELDRWPLDAEVLQNRFARLLSRCPEPEKHNRKRLSDEEIVQFISSSISKTPEMSRTRMLRHLRDGGRACEQGRFRDLYNQVMGDSDG
jgi:hypothetical protein